MEIKDLLSRYGYHTTPFTREFEVSDMMRLPDTDQAVAALERVITHRMSGALIAPAGTGKTVVFRALRANLPEARYRVRYVKVTDLNKRDMCREIAAVTGATPAGSYPGLVRNLQEHFVNCFDTDGLRPVLLLDEAHDLRPSVLAMLRLLTNFDMDSRLVVSVVLAGQPQLRTMLNRDSLEDIARRLAHYAVLQPLSRRQTTEYIEHRNTVAGANGSPFDNSALDAIYEIGRGNLRATDRLALKALEIAHDLDCDRVDSNHVAQARKQLWP